MDDFNWLIYIYKYDDLKNNGINTKEKALAHYKNYGLNEGRDCILEIFDIESYLLYNDDIKKKYDIKFDNLFEHWINFGIFEGRICSTNYFDWEKYIEENEDLQKENIDNEDKAINHYFFCGEKEKRILKNNFKFIKYKNFSFIKEYIDVYAKYSKIFNEKKNYIDIDLFFYKFVNDIDLYSKDELLNHFHINGYKGLIYHPKQLLNIFSKINFYYINNKIYIEYKNNLVVANKFVKKKIYEKDFYFFQNLLVRLRYNTIYNYENKDEEENISKKISNNSLIILVFIGNENIGNNLLDKIINYKNIENFDLACCFNSTELYKNMKDKIIENFEYSALYVTKEFGNDIIPTLLMYNDLCSNFKYQHIIKLQTKSDIHKYNELTDYLLSKNTNDLMAEKRIDCNCVSNIKYYFHVSRDNLNKEYYELYNDFIDINCHFIEGTIFYVNSIYFDIVVDFMKNNNFREYILNNLYDNNCTFYDHSPIHFLERLFGIVRIVNINNVDNNENIID